MTWKQLRRSGALLLITAATASACADECEKLSSSFQLDVRLADDVMQEATSLEVWLVAGEDRWRRTFELSGGLGARRTSLAVVVDPPRNAAFTLEVTARLHRGSGGAGGVIAEASRTFEARPDGCNHFELTLGATSPEQDAGPQDGGVDGGTQDGGVHPDAEPEDAGHDAGADDAGDRDAGVDDGGEDDAGAPDATPDAGQDDGGAPDAMPDAGAPDAMPDAGLEDAGDPDAGPPPCAVIDADTVALYTFSGDLADETGAHPGATAGSGLSYVAGPPGCGQALAFSGAASVQGHARVPHAAAFNLAEGSLDFWVRPASVGNQRAQGLVSRDSVTPLTSGHLTVWMACDGTVVAKLEPASGDPVYQCSNARLAANAWAHVGINFGPGGFELFVDGERATRSDTVGHGSSNCTITVPCGGQTTSGIATNSNPWIFGASAETSADGAGRPLPQRRPRPPAHQLGAARVLREAGPH